MRKWMWCLFTRTFAQGLFWEKYRWQSVITVWATDMLQYMGWTKIEWFLFNQVHLLDPSWKDARNLTPANAWLYDSLLLYEPVLNKADKNHPNKNLDHYFLCIIFN